MASSRKDAPEASSCPGSPVNAAPSDPACRVAACLRRHLEPGARIAVGYSGGLDSTVLLHVLARLAPDPGYRLSAVHVHHGLSPNAEAWSRHCQAVCDALGVPLQVVRVAVAPAGDGPEAAARAARYRAFAEVRADALVLAHHRDDQAETVLLQLLRGGGLKGLAAMPEARWLRPGWLRLLRPLLDSPRAELEAWARDRGLAWIEDESNRATHFARNALRHDLLPRLEVHFPGAGAVLAQAAAQFAEAADLLDDLAAADAGGTDSGDLSRGLALAPLRALPEPRARNLLRRFLERAGASLGQAALREALRQLRQARPDAQPGVEFGAVALKRYRDRVYAVARGGSDRPPAQGGEGVWRGEAELGLGALGCLRFQAVDGGGLRLEPGAVRIRARQGGERFRPDPRRPRRALKDWLREAALPPWRRQTVPLVYVGDRLAWVGGLGADADCLAGPGEPGWQLSWIPADTPG